MDRIRQALFQNWLGRTGESRVPLGIQRVMYRLDVGVIGTTEMPLASRYDFKATNAIVGENGGVSGGETRTSFIPDSPYDPSPAGTAGMHDPKQDFPDELQATTIVGLSNYFITIPEISKHSFGSDKGHRAIAR